MKRSKIFDLLDEIWQTGDCSPISVNENVELGIDGDDEDDSRTCPFCGDVMIDEDGLLVCPSCGCDVDPDEEEDDWG